MFNQLNLIIAAALALLLFGGGYAFGARKVGSLEAQIEEIRQKGLDADTIRKNSQTEIDNALKTQGEEHAKQVETLRADSERGRKDLAAALAAANDRNAELDKQRKANADKIAALSASGGNSAQIAELARRNEALSARSDPGACLALAVPAAVIRPLIK